VCLAVWLCLWNCLLELTYGSHSRVGGPLGQFGMVKTNAVWAGLWGSMSDFLVAILAWPFFSPAAPVIMYGSTGFWLIFGHATPRRKRKPLLSSILAALVCRHYRHLNPLFVAAAWSSFSRALDRIWQIENPFVASGCPCVHAWPYPALHNFNPVPQKCLLICIAKLPRCWDPGESFSTRHSLRFNYSLLGLVLIPLPSIWHCSLRLHNFALVCPRVESHLAEKYTL